jgi:hypothetical protein
MEAKTPRTSGTTPQKPGLSCTCLFFSSFFIQNSTAWPRRIQDNNNLGAEVDLGARATVVRKRSDGTIIDDAQELIKCSEYGKPYRNSDPTVRLPW